MFAGSMVGQYRITGTIGKGGMGAVYSAEHTLIGRVAAVKLLLPELSQNQEIVTRFFNEARAATAIRHPGIVEIYDFGYHSDGAAYIVMEYLQGEPLAARLARGRMAAQPALAIVRQISGALAAAHKKGIVHRDLKPDNVFLVPDAEVPGGERIKLLDFGIAKLANDGPNSSKTRTGSVMGTPTYMSPEQCRGVNVDHRADIYSLGCMLFELCTGRPPFVGEGVGDVLAAHIHVPPPSVQSLAPDVPHELEVLVQRMLVKDPAQRVQTAEEVIHAVDLATGGAQYRTGPRAASHGMPMPTSPAIPPPTTLSGAAQAYQTGAGYGGTMPPQRSRAGIFIGVGAVAVIGLVVAIVATQSGGGGGDKKTADNTVATGSETKPDTVLPIDAAPAPEPVVEVDAAVAPQNPDTPPQPPQPAIVDVKIASTPSGATLLRDGKSIGTTPYVGTLPQSDSTVTLVVRLAGHKDGKMVLHPSAPIDTSIKLEKKKGGGGRPGGGDGDRDQSVNPFGN
jgi:eukaryotic-like serine/threonine-protein kinase